MMLASGLVQHEAEQAAPALLPLLLQQEAAAFQVPAARPPALAGAGLRTAPLAPLAPPRVVARMAEEGAKESAEPDAKLSTEQIAAEEIEMPPAAEAPAKKEGFDLSNLSITISLAVVILVVNILGALGIIGN